MKFLKKFESKKEDIEDIIEAFYDVIDNNNLEKVDIDNSQVYLSSMRENNHISKKSFGPNPKYYTIFYSEDAGVPMRIVILIPHAYNPSFQSITPRKLNTPLGEDILKFRNRVEKMGFYCSSDLDSYLCFDMSIIRCILHIRNL